LLCRVVSVVGGEQIEVQGAALREGCHVVVATPGRLKDCLERRYAVLQQVPCLVLVLVLVLSPLTVLPFVQCNYLVLDEADRMVDMGFEEDLRFILSSMQMEAREQDEDEPLPGEPDEEEADLSAVPANTGRTTILYSATMPPSVERIARSYLQRPVSVTIGSAGKVGCLLVVVAL
jgi:ATP-dependent RNA helicase DDX23/PRP28